MSKNHCPTGYSPGCCYSGGFNDGGQFVDYSGAVYPEIELPVLQLGSDSK